MLYIFIWHIANSPSWPLPHLGLCCLFSAPPWFLSPPNKEICLLVSSLTALTQTPKDLIWAVTVIGYKRFRRSIPFYGPLPRSCSPFGNGCLGQPKHHINPYIHKTHIIPTESMRIIHNTHTLTHTPNLYRHLGPSPTCAPYTLKLSLISLLPHVQQGYHYVHWFIFIFDCFLQKNI